MPKRPRMEGNPLKDSIKQEPGGNKLDVILRRIRNPKHAVQITNVKFSRGDADIMYEVEWKVDIEQPKSETIKTWEPKRFLDQMAAEDDEFKVCVWMTFLVDKQDYIDELKQKKEEYIKGRQKPGWYYESASQEEEEPEVFYGANPNELTGETARLFDPSHKFSETEKILALMNTEKRLTRSQTNAFRRAESDSPTDSGRSTPVTMRGRKTGESKRVPPPRRGRGAKTPAGKRPEPAEGPKSDILSTSDEPIIKEIVVNQEPDTSPEKMDFESVRRIPTKQARGAKRRPIVQDSDSDREERNFTFEPKRVVNQQQKQATPPPSASQVSPPANVSQASPAKNVSQPSTATNVSQASPPTNIPTTSQEPPKTRPLVGRRVVPMGLLGVTEGMMNEALKPVEEIKRLAAKASRDALAETIEQMNACMRPYQIPMEFSRAVLTGRVKRAREIVGFHKEYPMAVNFKVSQLDPHTGYNLLHRICQISCNDAAVRRPEHPHSLCDMVEFLIISGVDPRISCNQKKTALQMALEKSLLCRVRRLLSLRAPVNIPGIQLKDSPLFIAYMSKNRAAFRLLLEHGANFAQLDHEVTISKIPTQKFLREDLSKHKEMLRRALGDAKRKVLVDIEELHAVSPLFVANFYEGPTLWFDFNYNGEQIPSSDYFFVLFVSTAVVDERGRWHLALWGDSPLNTEPLLNNEAVTPIQYIEQFGPMNTSSKKSAVFIGTPCIGANRLSLTLHHNKAPPPIGDAFAYSMTCNWKVVLQMSLLRRNRPQVSQQQYRAPPGSRARQRPVPLEHAPDAPSSYY